MTTQLLFDIPLQRTPMNICINLMLAEPEFLGYVHISHQQYGSISFSITWLCQCAVVTPVPSYQLNNLSVISLCCKIMLKTCSE